ncbi:MAG: homoserine O-acetyltransferase [Burkholderiales bacterium]
MRILAIVIAALLTLSPPALFAYDKPVEKKVFSLPSYTTVGGRTIRDVKVGYETYGTLNAAGDNAVFIAHFYSGNSHAAGKYKESDPAPGYWNSIIGPGKPIDTDRYFVISADTLSNLNTKDPMTTTTGPSSINPETGRPYGLSFPVISMRDSVRVHKALTDTLGVKKFKAVAGASGGSIQAMEWGVLYGDQVERVIHVIGPGFSISPWVIGLLDLWVAPIKLDPNWNSGDYYGRAEPLAGIAEALKTVTLTAGHWGWAEKAFGYKLADDAKKPGADRNHLFQIEDVLNKTGLARARTTDANNKIYMAKANQLFNVEDEIGRIRAKILFVPASSDLIFPPEMSQKAATRFRAQGGAAEVFVLEGDRGHLDGVIGITKAADAIRAFMAR